MAQALQRGSPSPEAALVDAAPWSALDLAVLAAASAVAALAVAFSFSWRMLPAEDALMLMRYANHLAAGHGIVWNVGDHPVEGATDFLFLVALAGWMKLTHLQAIISARLLLSACQVMGVALLYIAARKIAGCNRWLAAVLAIYLALGPGVTQIANGFSGPFYSLMALTAWCFAISAALRHSTLSRSIGFAAFALLTGLTRPDGVFLAFFMTCALAYFLRKASRQIVFTTAAVFVFLGGAYFLWRVHYFGHLLPNPFYKKGGGHLYPSSLRVAVGNVFRLLMPFVPVYFAGILAPLARRITIFSLIPVIGFTSIWILLTSENSTGMRFQYAVVPFALLSIAAIAPHLAAQMRQAGWNLRWQPRGWVIAVLLLCITFTFKLYWRSAVEGPQLLGTGPYRIAVGLSKFADRNYTIATTEAGVVPYFSNWRAIDAYGLNDEEIVHNPKGLTAEYLDKSRPAIITLFMSPEDMAAYRRVWYGQAPLTYSLGHIPEEASYYAVSHGYVLAARWGPSPCAFNAWYVRRDLPDFDEIMAIIRQTPHFYPYGGGMAQNFLGPDPPTVCGDSQDVLGLHQ